MKSLCPALLFFLTCGFAYGEVMLTKEQASKLARLVLDAKENEKYKGFFKIEDISYDDKEDVWRFPAMGMHSLTVFQIRDKDGQYMIGVLNDSRLGGAPPRFRISPALRGDIRKLLDEFAKERGR